MEEEVGLEAQESDGDEEACTYLSMQSMRATLEHSARVDPTFKRSLVQPEWSPLRAPTSAFVPTHV